MGARKLKGGNMSRIKAIQAGLKAAKRAIGKITKKTDLETLAKQIAEQSKAAQQPGKRLSKTAQEVRKRMTSKGNAARFVERRKQLSGARKSKPIGGKRN